MKQIKNGKPGREMNEEEYKQFLDKFERKRTTDEQDTPPKVYKIVLQYVQEKYSEQVKGLEVCRPFYPGGDYQQEDYKGKVVVDNPPFSIITQIVEFYKERNIPFFLFCPQNTAPIIEGTTSIYTGAQIKYEQGARVSTAFVTNLTPQIAMLQDKELGKEINALFRLGLKPTKKPANAIGFSDVLSGRVKSPIFWHEVKRVEKSKYFGRHLEIKDEYKDKWRPSAQGKED